MPEAGTIEGKAVREASQNAVPTHVAVIMDGNGRWATGKGLLRSEGHRRGVENVRRVLRRFAHHDIPYVTLFAFSTENWERPDEEVSALMELIGGALRDETGSLHKEGVRIHHIGRLTGLHESLRRAIADAVELTKNNTRLVLSVAFNYGGKAEIVDAVRQVVASGLSPEAVTESVIERYLYTKDIPDPDMIIRTGGEMRLSNFLLWQAAYSEYYASSTMWPDFDENEIDMAVEAYGQRKRRYGNVTPPSP